MKKWLKGQESISKRIQKDLEPLVKSPKGRRLVVLIGWAILFGLLATGELWIVRMWHPFVDTMKEDIPIWEIFFSVFGLTYAILVGLIIVEAHRRWRELSSTIQREINAIVDIRDFLRYFKDPGKWAADDAPRQEVIEVIEALLIYYKKEFTNQTWTQKEVAGRRHDREHVHHLIDSVQNLEPKDTIHKYALEAIVGKVSEMTSSRNERIEIMLQGLKGVFYGILFFMSAIIVTGFCLLGVQEWWLSWLLVVMTTVSLCTLFLLVRDLDHPVRGFWNIGEEVASSSKTLFERFQSDLERWAGSSEN